LDLSKGVLYAECRVELSLSKTILFSTFISLPADLQTQQGLRGVLRGLTGSRGLGTKGVQMFSGA